MPGELIVVLGTLAACCWLTYLVLRWLFGGLGKDKES